MHKRFDDIGGVGGYIGGSVVLTEGACPALGVQPSRDVVFLMLEEPAALASTQNDSGLSQGPAGRPAAG